MTAKRKHNMCFVHKIFKIIQFLESSFILIHFCHIYLGSFDIFAQLTCILYASDSQNWHLVSFIVPENRLLSLIVYGTSMVFPEIRRFRSRELVLVSIRMFDHEKSNCSNSLYFDLLPEFRLRCEKCAKNYDEAFQRILFWQINYQ